MREEVSEWLGKGPTAALGAQATICYSEHARRDALAQTSLDSVKSGKSIRLLIFRRVIALHFVSVIGAAGRR